MAVAQRVASSLSDALDLTPNQILGLCGALTRLRGGTDSPGPRGQRYGTIDEFKMAIFGMVGRR